MSSSSPPELSGRGTELLWHRYTDNWVRRLGLVAERGDRIVRESLEAAGYSSLDSQLIGPLSLLYLNPQRASEMALALGVSQAYTTKLVKRLEKAGYCERVDDPCDRRARWVQLSRAGRKLIQAALKQLESVSRQYQARLGDKHDLFLAAAREAGYSMLGLERRDAAPPGLESDMIAVVLSVVSELVQRTIGRMNAEKGYSGLTIAHWRVIHDIGLEGSTNALLAERQSLSTQAISRTVRELLAMGYIERNQHVHDARVSRIIYSPRAFDLLACTADCIQALGKMLDDVLPRGHFAVLRDSLALMHAGLEITEASPQADSRRTLPMAQQLKVELSQLVDVLTQGREATPEECSLFSQRECDDLAAILRAKLT